MKKKQDFALKPSKSEARTSFFQQGVTIHNHGNHRHIFTLNKDDAQVSDMKLDASGEVIGDTVRSKTVTKDEAFDLFWIQVMKNSPKELLMATFSAITEPKEQKPEKGVEEPSALNSTYQ